MIRCPHCGSTAQVKSNSNPQINTKTELLTEGFYCGCGCEWEVDYARDENGYWEVYTEIIIAIKEPINKLKGHIHCPANGYDCPYWKNGICNLWSEEEGYIDPYEECADFVAFWDKDDDYIDYDVYEEFEKLLIENADVLKRLKEI